MGAFVNLKGRRFGWWEVLHRDDTKPRGRVYWVCKCKCGVIKSLPNCGLVKKTDPKCRSCTIPEMILRLKKSHHIRTAPDFTGHVIGDILVSEKLQDSNWKCKCVCGYTWVTTTKRLKNLKRDKCHRCSRRKYRPDAIGKCVTCSRVLVLTKTKPNGTRYCSSICKAEDKRNYAAWITIERGQKRRLKLYLAQTLELERRFKDACSAEG